MEDSVLKEFMNKEFMNKLEAFRSEHKEILGRISGLTCEKLLSDLQEALKYQKGYYKNKKGGLYIH